MVGLAGSTCIIAGRALGRSSNLLGSRALPSVASCRGGIGNDAPTVGRGIRRLEETLERTLFEQTRAGQKLAEAGENLLLKVEAMEQASAEIENTVEGNQPTGLLRVSASEGFGTWFVAHH